MATMDPALLRRILSENPMLAAQLLSGNGAARIFAPDPPVVDETGPGRPARPAALGDEVQLMQRPLGEIANGPFQPQMPRGGLGPSLDETGPPPLVNPERLAAIQQGAAAIPGYDLQMPQGLQPAADPSAILGPWTGADAMARRPGQPYAGQETSLPWLPELPELTEAAQRSAGIDPTAVGSPLPSIVAGRPAKADDVLRRDGGTDSGFQSSKSRTAEVYPDFTIEPSVAADGGLPAAPPQADLALDGSRAVETIRQLQKNDHTRGGTIIGTGAPIEATPATTVTETGQTTLSPPEQRNAAASAVATDGRVVPSAVEEEQLYSHTLPGGLGRGQDWVRGKLGLDDRGSFRVGQALMHAGGAILSGAGIGGGVTAGLRGYTEAGGVIRGDEDRALEREETQKRIDIAQQTLDLNYQKFEHDKAQAALERLDPLKSLREDVERKKLEREQTLLEGGGSLWDRLSPRLTSAQQGKLASMLASGMDVIDPETGLLTEEARRILTGEASAGLDDLLGE